MAPRMLASLLGLVCLTGCDVLSGFNNTADEAVAVIDQGIQDIREESADWRVVLQRVADDLPKEVGELIRNDAQNLVSRSIAQTGVEFRCNTDFLAHRASMALARLKAKVLGETLPLLPPAFCQVTPDAIDLKAEPASWSKVVLSGYDFDHEDAAGKQFTLELVSADGNVTEVDDARIGRTTHYQATVNLGDIAAELHAKKINKILVRWGGQHDGYPQVVVLPWEAERQLVRGHNPGSTTWKPPHKRGDGDFFLHKKLVDLKGKRTASLDLRAESKITRDRRKVQTRVYMKAREAVPDHTTVAGWSGWRTAYEAPKGKQIVSAQPLGLSRFKGAVTGRDKGRGYYHRLPRGEVAKEFRYWVDRKGDDVPGYTRVDVTWAPLQVTLVDQKPEWTR